MRIGIFGGTFDPVHQAHLVIAEQCREQAQLDQVWFIPAARPPHKQDRPLTPFHQRVEMLALAIAGNPAFRINELEKDRPGLSYTVDTLQELHHRHPGQEFFLLVGSDILPDLPHWREPERIAQLAGFLVWPRPEGLRWNPDQVRSALGLAPDFPLEIQWMQGLQFDIASHDLRRRVGEGRSIRYLVPRAVECYIGAHHLYLPEGEPGV
ncbi:MAG: nicotinate (nicotinamide) nucleotide adenylyltransferase [Planctomycetes bacterium]|nr:nicotinate (nicotinamide) nucleotide adenylyltransferase [Planctomycetota bacterium]